MLGTLVSRTERLSTSCARRRRATASVNPTSVDDMPRVAGLTSSPVTELAIVICKPSRTHAAPSPATMRVWNGDQLKRSRRAGIVERIDFCVAAVVLRQAFLSLSAQLRPSTPAQAQVRSDNGARPCASSKRGEIVRQLWVAPAPVGSSTGRDRRSIGSQFSDARTYLIRSSRWSPTRSEFAIAVKAGFTAPMLGKMLVSTT
jgi:hypothetical protein